MKSWIRHHSWYVLFTLGMILASLFFVPARAGVESPTGKRLALVVGNSKYQSVYSLKNAVNDSHAVAKALTGLGFEVTSLDNVGQKDFQKGVDDFSKKAEGAEATLFYFSGHGFQLKGANYLVPTDASLKSAEAIEKETLRLDTIIAGLQARDRQTLIFLDACRNNPLPESVRGKNGAEGLAQIETGSGTFVAFATQPGNITRDGVGDNSPFTTALLDYIDTPGISISDMMIKVRTQVEEKTLEEQTPWDQSSLRSQFYFAPEAEGDDALTEEDRQLLLSLDPELRKKFEARFGLSIESVEDVAEGEEAKPQAPMIAVIQPAVSIGAADEEPSPTETPAPAQVAIVSTLKIESGDEEVAQGTTPDTVPVPLARPQEPEKEVVLALNMPEDSNRPLAQSALPDLPPVEPQPLPAMEAAPATVPAPAAVAAPATDLAPAIAPAPETAPSMPAPASAVPVETVAVPALPQTNSQTLPQAEIGGSSLPQAEKSDRVAPVVAAVQPVAPGNNGTRAISPETEMQPKLTPVEPSQSVAGVELDAPVALADPFAVPAPAPTVEPVVPAKAETASLPASAQPETAPLLTPALEAVAAAPSIPAPAAPAAAAPQEPEQKLASLAPDQIKPDLVAPVVPEPGLDLAAKAALPRAIQEQLARLGCYRSPIDGNWGAGSAKALLRYYATKREAPDDLDPSDILLAKLTNEETVICKTTKAAPIVKKQAPKVVAKPVKAGPKVATKQPKILGGARKSAQGAAKPAKKTLSGGLGAFR